MATDRASLVTPGHLRALSMAFGVNLVVAGTTAYSFGLFVVPVSEALGASRLQLGLAHTATLVVMAVMAPWVGAILDRARIHRVLFTGALLLGAGFFALPMSARAETFILYYALLVGGAKLLTGPLATSTLIGKTFSEGRSRALAIAALGASAGGFGIPLLVGAIISSSGWRAAYIVLGLLATGVLAPGIWLAGRTTPRSTASSRAEVRDSSAKQSRMDELLRSRTFWLIAVPIGLGYFAIQGGLVNLAALAVSRGSTPFAAAAAVSVMTASTLGSKLITAALGDRITPRVLISIALVTVSVGLMILFTSPAPEFLMGGAVVFGLGGGGLFPQLGAAAGHYFGSKQFGRVMGLIYPIIAGFSMIATPIWGAVFDRTGSYQVALLLGAAAALCGAIAVWALPEREGDSPIHARP